MTFILILQVFYFTQIYPFIHFHHTHQDDGFQVAVSVHPVDHEADHSEEPGTDKHHHERDHYLGDWTYIKPQAKQTSGESALFLLGTTLVIPEPPHSFSPIREFTALTPTQETFLSSDLPRSPPLSFLES